MIVLLRLRPTPLTGLERNPACNRIRMKAFNGFHQPIIEVKGRDSIAMIAAPKLDAVSSPHPNPLPASRERETAASQVLDRGDPASVFPPFAAAC
jgi:hypothetical protein